MTPHHRYHIPPGWGTALGPDFVWKYPDDLSRSREL